MDQNKRETTVISIVTYEAPEYFRKCLDDLDWTADLEHVHVVVFDNSKSEDIEKVVKDHGSNYVYYRSKENLGYGKSHNKVWKYGKKNFDAKRILILNPDLIIKKDAFQKLEDILDIEDNVAITAPKIVKENGEQESSVFNDPGGIAYFLDFAKQIFSKKRDSRIGMEKIEQRSEIKGATGACLFVRGDAIKEKYIFDPEYFMYFEDLDLCHRLREDNWKIIFEPSASVVHYIGRSSVKIENRDRWLKEMMYRSVKKYFRKNKGWFDNLIINFSLWTALQLRILLNVDKEWAKRMLDDLY